MAPKFSQRELSLARKICGYATWNGMQGLKLRESRHKKINCCVTETRNLGMGNEQRKRIKD